MERDMEIHPDTFDVIVLGTGLPESILAAAAAAAGLTVLHLDGGDVYGSAWASLSPEAVAAHAGGAVFGEEDGVAAGAGAADWRLISMAGSGAFSGFKAGLLDDEGEAGAGTSELGRLSAYNLDLAGPKLAFSAGPLVDLMLRAGASSYLEFKAVERSYLWTAGGLVTVPASQAEVFQDQSLSLVEKRLLMRFLKLVTDQAGAGFAEEDLDGPFVELLRKQRLPASLQAMVLYAFAFAESDQEGEGGEKLSARDGLQRLAVYRASVGRFTNAPGAFIYPLYGQGELPQAFCRCAAVKGALYVLRRPVDAVLVDRESGGYKGVRTRAGQLLFSRTLVAGRPHLPVEVEGELAEACDEGRAAGGDARAGKVARLVCVTDATLNEGQANLLVVFPPGSVRSGFSRPVYALQLGGGLSVCPQDRFAVYLSTVWDGDDAGAEDVLLAAARALLSDEGGSRPKVLWSAFFFSAGGEGPEAVVKGQVAVCPMPDQSVHYGDVVSATERIFHQLFPTADFFPAAAAASDGVGDGDSAVQDENGAVHDENGAAHEGLE